MRRASGLTNLAALGERNISDQICLIIILNVLCACLCLFVMYSIVAFIVMSMITIICYV